MALVDDLIQSQVLKTPSIIEAFRHINRTDFLPEEYRLEAEVNAPLPIGHGQTISQPLTVALMLEWLSPEAGERVMDVGSGSGWQTALLAYIVSQQTGGLVIAIERISELKNFGEKNITKYDYIKSGVVKCFAKDGALGQTEFAPYDKIIIAAAAPRVPQKLLSQLKTDGRLVMPMGDEFTQTIVVIDKTGEDTYKEERHPGFAFVPFISDKL